MKIDKQQSSLSRLLFMLVGAVLVLATAGSYAAEKPNIIFIMADDLGWQDVGYAGAEFFETPHIDAVASQGTVFTNAYTGGPNCSPTRACLMSGMYTPRHAIYQPGGKSKGNPKFMRLLVPTGGRKNAALRDKAAAQFTITNQLHPKFVCIPEVLKPAGYTSARLGKWHLGTDTQGFDLSSSDGKGGPGKTFYGDVDVAEQLTDRAVEFIEQNQEGPFFLYLSHWDVHTPHRARKEVVGRYQDKLDKIPAEKRRNFNAVYAAMIEAVDVSVGRIVAKVDQLGLADNTLIIFTSDNGGLSGVSQLDPLRGEKGSLFEAGVRVPACMRWTGTIRPKSTCPTPITSVDYLPTLASLAGAKLPTTQPVDGTDISPLLREKSIAQRSIFWHYPLYLSGKGLTIPLPGGGTYSWRGVPATAMRRGDYKLMEFHEDDSVALYNLKDDPGEQTNLAETMPDLAATLRAEMDAWQKETKAPIPTELNPAYDLSANVPKKENKRAKNGAKTRQTARLFIPSGQETLPPLSGNVAPQTFDEMWKGFDPRAEPLEVEVLKEWEEDGVVLRVLRYRIGIFKGQKAMMAAVYGYPKGGKNLPGLVQIHGGGQYADYRAPLTNAKRGYATISISWAGRINAPDYTVNPSVVKLFWDGNANDPNYKLTTDWGALDGYHAPSKHNGPNAFVSIPTAEWTLDAVASPRNNSWFLCTLGARRALTFLEQQPEVDGEKLGVYGHSMGGKLTVLTAGADARVKAAAPSCGGISDRYNKNELHRNTVGDAPSLKKISCPIIFLSPANDFHGHINDLIAAVDDIKTPDWRVTCSAHLNHRDLPESEVATQLWFDQYLKGSFTWPATPETSLKLDGEQGVPAFTVRPDTSKPVLGVDIFYCPQGHDEGEGSHHENRIARFWRHAVATKRGDIWAAHLPLFSTDKPLWVYANVLYPLDEPVTGAGYYYGSYTADRFNLSSLIEIVAPEQLQAAGVKAVLKPSRMIETFEGDWEKEWFTYRPADWTIRTHKVYDPQWAAADGAKLSLEVRSDKVNTLVVGMDHYGAEVQLSGDGAWQTVTLSAADFTDAAGVSMSGWTGIKELRLGAQDRLKATKHDDNTTRTLGGVWSGAKPDFRNLGWR